MILAMHVRPIDAESGSALDDELTVVYDDGVDGNSMKSSSASASHHQSRRPPPTSLQIGIKKVVKGCRRKAVNGFVFIVDVHGNVRSDQIKVHYTGTLFETGAVFDSSITRGEPLPFQLGFDMRGSYSL